MLFRLYKGLIWTSRTITFVEIRIMKHLSILVPDQQTSLSTAACIVGSYQVFSTANDYFLQQNGTVKFKIELVGANSHDFLNNEFLSIRHEACIDDVATTNLIIIPASRVRTYEDATANNKILIDWMAKQYKMGAELASMCAGGFMLAATGFLSGKSCSTHWALSSEFKENYPAVKLHTDQLITDEDGIYSNGGAYSFLHLLMYLVEKYFDRQTAIHCAKYFQIDLDRNRQSEFAIFKGHKRHQDREVLTAQELFEKDFCKKLSIESLSSKLNIGRRSFDRRFVKATGITPLDYLQRVRVEVAKKKLETTRKTVNEVMYEVGYADAKAFREVFGRITGMSPLDYKRKYNREGKWASS